MDAAIAIVRQVNEIVWGPAAWAILLGGGFWLSIKTNFLQITKFTVWIDLTIVDMFRKPENKKAAIHGEGDITPWQAVNTAFCATMGVGTLVGTANAIAFGGPGAVFWMWVVGFFGIATKFSEVTLAVHFRQKNEKGEMLSGPFAYMEKGLGKKWLAVWFAFFGAIAAFGIGNMVQSNSAAFALNHVFGFNRLYIGIVAAILIGLVIIGGLKSIAKVVERIIPFLAIMAIISSFLIIITNLGALPESLRLIFVGAFTSEGLVGGVAGVSIMYAIRLGLARGIFSNEAGLGSAPIAYSAAKTDHPVKQGLWASFEVFMDTHVMCTLVALAILATVPLDVIAPSFFLPGMDPALAPGMSGASLVITAYANSFLGPQLGSWLMAFLIGTFGFTTVIGWAFYGEKCFEYLCGSTKYVMFYRLLMLPVCVFGAYGGVALIWALADGFNAFMALPNIVAIVLLGGTVSKLFNDFFENKPYEPAVKE
ncbi:MAG: sodium:alanine symporter family protein [Defluviitaleaceae bacterium]|nr:sodium:alanine symporter family protein [Defluviitaleaceae bacterium]